MRISFLIGFAFYALFELAVVSAALRTGHHTRALNFFQAPLAHMHIAKKMPMLGPKMHASCFRAIFLLKDCFVNGKLVLSAKLEQEAPIVITVTNAVPTKYSFPGY